MHLGLLLSHTKQVSCSSYNQHNDGQVNDINAKSGQCHPGYTGKKCTAGERNLNIHQSRLVGKKYDYL